ncbi:MAG: hypothetical protein M1562_02495 [Candidatus Marsarchaeota archaeon]|jgi:drug/metabolite transporter (DMT)-like permease|nr:hypothetical protein [Candidatus Marsarchaeota archaeon]
MSVKSDNIKMLVVSTLLGAVAQLLFKISLDERLFLLLFGGVLIYLLSSFIYLYVISRSHLSWAYGIGGLSYIFTVVLAAVFIEGVPPIRWAGVVVITIGVMLIAFS